MTTVVILQPGYLPWLGFFDQMRQADVFVYYDDVQFDKMGWRNRNRIKGPNGPLWLTVPVLHKGRGEQAINQVEIADTQPWATKHIRTIKQNYARAPFLNDYLPALENVLNKPWQRLVELDYAVIELFRAWLNLDTQTIAASELKIEGGQTERLVNICRQFQAKTYLSGSSARDYLDATLFADAGIELRWHDYEHPAYEQVNGPFISHLSALDLILNLGPRSRTILSGNG